jgi:hypothetical protein
MSLKIGVLNIRHGCTLPQARSDLLRAAESGAHILVVTEMAGVERMQMVKSLSGWDAHVAMSDQGQQAVHVLWRTDLGWNLIGTYSDWLSDPTFVGDEGAGPDVIAQKWITSARWRSPQLNRTVTVGGVHLVPTVHLPIRDRLHEQQVAKAAQWVREVPRGLVFLAGDFNAEHKHPNLAPLTDESMGRPLQSNHMLLGEKPTLQRRAIDHVFSQRRQAVRAVRHRVTRKGLYTDHALVVVQYRLRRRGAHP